MSGCALIFFYRVDFWLRKKSLSVLFLGEMDPGLRWGDGLN